MPSLLDTPLSDAERDQLADFLDSCEGAMDVETLDGFFCALIVNNARLRPQQWMPLALGPGGQTWPDPARMEAMLSLLLRKWNEVAHGFRLDWREVDESVMKDEMYLPDVNLEDAQAAAPLASRWARGFGRALGLLDASALRRLERDEEAVATLSLIAGLDLGQNDAGVTFDHAQRKSLVAHALIGLQYIYRLSHSTAERRSPVRVAATPGRNDPCPCGSGQKFKRCCGAPERLH